MKTALIQQKFYGNKTDTVKATVKKIQEAASNRAELVVLQELHQVLILVFHDHLLIGTAGGTAATGRYDPCGVAVGFALVSTHSPSASA